MKMSTTNGDINNSDFRRELILSQISSKYLGVNYLNKINIGGLNGITLNRENSTITKYNGEEYSGDSGDISRRWYGEIYLPSSTIVVDNTVLQETMNNNKIIENLSKGIGVLEKGYLMITFENIETTADSIASYLNYAILRNSDGMKISPETPSVLVQEKEGKEEITLPNGNKIKNLPETFKNTDAPVIIYDVSLRANNDYESTGTH